MTNASARIEDIELMTKEYWEREYKRECRKAEAKKQACEREKAIYFLKQRTLGLLLALLSVALMFYDKDATFSLFIGIPLGVTLMVTEKRVLML